MERVPLMLSTAMAAALGALALAATLVDLPATWPGSEPDRLLALTLGAAACWGLLSPLLVPTRALRQWLTAGALATAALAGPLAAGARLAHADHSVLVAALALVAALWVGASGVHAALARWTARPAAHHVGLVGALCVGLPLLDYLSLEPLTSSRCFGALSPLEWAWWLEPAGPAASWTSIAVLLAIGIAGIAAARR